MEFFHPHLLLQDYISGYYLVEGNNEVMPQQLSSWSRVFIVINYGDDVILGSSSGLRLLYKGITCSGIFQRPTFFGAGIANLRLVCIEIMPEFACDLLKANMQDLVDQSIYLHEISMFKSISYLPDALYSLRNDQEKICLLDKIFIGYFQKINLAQNQNLKNILEVFRRYNGCINLKRASQETGLSKRTLIRYANNFLGMSPLKYARITRNEYTISKLLKEGYNMNLVQDLVHELEFYDQAHLINEIKKATGFTPASLVKSHGFECLKGVLDFPHR